MAAEQCHATNLQVEDPLSAAVEDILESDSVNVALLKKSPEEETKQTTIPDEKPSAEEVTSAVGESAPPGRPKFEESPVEVAVPTPQANTLPALGSSMMAQQSFANFPSVVYTPVLPVPTPMQPGYSHQAAGAASYVRIATPIPNNAQAYQCVVPAQSCQSPIRYPPPPYPTAHQTMGNPMPIVTQQPTQNASERVLPEYTSKSTTCWCPTCEMNVQTSTDYVVGDYACLCSLVLCIFCGIICALIPLVMSSCKDVNHTCPRCGQRLLYYKRSGS